MIRVGVLTDYAQFDENYRDNKTGMTAQEQLNEVCSAVAPLYTLREQFFSAVMEGLGRHGLYDSIGRKTVGGHKNEISESL